MSSEHRTDLVVDLAPELARALVAYSSDGLVIVDAGGTLRFASPCAERMLGYEGGETLGRNVFEMVHPDDQVGALEGFESTRSSADSRPLPTLVRLLRADGSWLQTEIIGTNYIDDEHVRGLLLNIRDVERSMRTEAALRESEEHHRLIVELAREGVWTIDAEGRTTFANRAMAEMLDTTVTDMLDRSMYDFMDDDAAPRPKPSRGWTRAQRRVQGGARHPAHDEDRSHRLDAHEHQCDHGPRRRVSWRHRIGH